MIEHKQLHEWSSWRDEWTYAEVEKALADAGLEGWTIDHWSDGDIQFMRAGPVSVPFEDLVKLRNAFTPLRMVIEAVVDCDAEDEQRLEWERNGSKPLERGNTPLMVLVTMSCNVVKEEAA